MMGMPLTLMKISNESIALTETDLKEVFGLFSSPAKDELKWTIDPNHSDFFERINLSETYELCQEKREFALDSLRGVLAFLHCQGYRIEKGGETFSLEGIFEHFYG